MVEAGLYIELFVQFDEGRGCGRTGGVGRIVCASPEKTSPYSCGSNRMNYSKEYEVLAILYIPSISKHGSDFPDLNIYEKVEL